MRPSGNLSRSPRTDSKSSSVGGKRHLLGGRARGFSLDGGWGVDPLVTFVPDEATWDRVVPEWLKGRKTEVVERLKAEEGHVVKADHGFRALPDREVFLL